MTKKIIFIVILLVILGLGIFFIIKNKKTEEEEVKIEKFYLSDKYYANGDFISVDYKELKELNKDSYVLYTYNNFCIFTIPCEDIFKEIMVKDGIDVVSITFENFKKTDFYKEVKLAPSILIIKEGKIVTYLRADSDEDFDRYQDTEAFEKWLNNYIYLEKEASE